MTDLQDVGTRDPGKAVPPVRREYLRRLIGSGHQEEVRGVARRNEAVRVKHQCLIRTSRVRLDASSDVVELRVRVELRVEHVRGSATYVRREERDAVDCRRRKRVLVL